VPPGADRASALELSLAKAQPPVPPRAHNLFVSTTVDILTTTDKRAVTLAPEAAAKVASFLTDFMASEDSNEDAVLRLGVRGGGCSGFQYAMAFDIPHDDDVCFESEGQRIVISAEALPYVAGSRIIWNKKSPMEEGFDVENPNATASCGCGSSFRIDPNAGGCSEPEGPPTSEDAVY
jgi:iron-sulfur cluster assembly accessory protein